MSRDGMGRTQAVFGWEAIEDEDIPLRYIPVKFGLTLPLKKRRTGRPKWDERYQRMREETVA